MRIRISAFDAIIILVIFLVAGFIFAIMPKWKVDVAPPSACDLNRQPCAAELPNKARLEFAIDPRPVPSAQPVSLKATVAGAEPDQVAVEFTGVAMNMGNNRAALTTSGSGTYVGQATLPVCTTGRMLWRASVLVEYRRRVFVVPFEFESGAALN